MDWDKNGMVNFKEFLFAFTHWVGIEDIDDDEDEGLDNVWCELLMKMIYSNSKTKQDYLNEWR